MVYLMLQPYRQSTLKKSGVEKLKPRYYGPFRIVRGVDEVAYELELPANSASKRRWVRMWCLL